MAITISDVPVPTSGQQYLSLGNVRGVIKTVTFDSSYPTNGETVTAAQVGLNQIYGALPVGVASNDNASSDSVYTVQPFISADRTSARLVLAAVPAISAAVTGNLTSGAVTGSLTSGAVTGSLTSGTTSTTITWPAATVADGAVVWPEATTAFTGAVSNTATTGTVTNTATTGTVTNTALTGTGTAAAAPLAEAPNATNAAAYSVTLLFIGA